MAEPTTYTFLMNKELNEMIIVASAALKMTKNDFIVYSIQRTLNDEPKNFNLPPTKCGAEHDNSIQINLKIDKSIMDHIDNCSFRFMERSSFVRRCIWYGVRCHRARRILTHEQALRDVCTVVTRELSHDEYCVCPICRAVERSLDSVGQLMNSAETR